MLFGTLKLLLIVRISSGNTLRLGIDTPLRRKLEEPEGNRKSRKGNERVGCMKATIHGSLFDTYLSLVSIEARKDT